jgi:hypothetical protein
MSVINNLKYLGGSDTKKTSRAGAFSLKFDNQKVNSIFCNNTSTIFHNTNMPVIIYVPEEKCCQDRTP